MPSPELQLLCELGDHLRDAVLGARGIDMTAIEDETPADTIYAIDKVTDDALVAWFERRWHDVEVVSEGLHEPLVIGDPKHTVIVDTIDGTRGLMYDKRSAWSLAAVAPHGGTLRDVVAASMTELPTAKQTLADQISGERGGGISAHRFDLRTHDLAPLSLRPSTAVDLEHGFAQLAKFFPPGKATLAAIESDLFSRLGASTVFDDEYISSGGQVHELLTGRDRFVADLRPLVDPRAFACHPYDLCTTMLLEEAGGVVTDPWGDPLDCPLDTTTPVAWVGYANPTLAEQIGPVLAEVLRDHVGR
jgi:fructose-1,6-bisphosphatase/inositol monophosphatase family enzyme